MPIAPSINALVASAAGPAPSPIRLDSSCTTSSQLAAGKATADTDADVLASLKRPGAQADFAFIEGQDELCQVIEAGDFGAGRIFLHPEQRRYGAKTFSGPFRLFGGAGTGKTVVLAPTIVIESTRCEIAYMHATSG